MNRRGVSGVSVAAGVIVGLVVGLGAMYVLAPSIIGSPTLTVTNSNASTSTVASTTTSTSIVGGPGVTTVTSTTTLTVPISTLPAITSTVTQVSTETNTVTSTVNEGQGFTGSVVHVSIPSGTGLKMDQNFSPSTITVVIGVNSTVLWTNNDDVQHTVTADTLRFFNTVLDPGQTFGYTFTQPGTYGYSCQFHGWMIAKVIVKS